LRKIVLECSENNNEEILQMNQPTEMVMPATSYQISRQGYYVAYDPRTRNAIYVYEKLASDCLQGRVSRDGCRFKEDALIPKIFRSTLKDYQKSGYDRGHLACAANHGDSVENMEDTFFLSNISPQNQTFNRGYWALLEKHVRNLTKKYSTVEVFTGPLYLPKEESGIKIVAYRVIGDGDVAVPTHFFKVISSKNHTGSNIVEAYILPNDDIPPNTPLNSFQTSIEKVQKAAGVLFFNN
jgi:endonuclease G, mitochondrial